MKCYIQEVFDWFVEHRLRKPLQMSGFFPRPITAVVGVFKTRILPRAKNQMDNHTHQTIKPPHQQHHSLTIIPLTSLRRPQNRISHQHHIIRIATQRSIMPNPNIHHTMIMLIGPNNRMIAHGLVLLIRRLIRPSQHVHI